METPVPRYHFNVHDGVSLPDPDGTELATLDAARVEAVRLAGQLLLDSGEEFWSNGDWKVDVTNDRGLILFTLMFSAFDAPCIRSR
jgi:hypothetical protein